MHSQHVYDKNSPYFLPYESLWTTGVDLISALIANRISHEYGQHGHVDHLQKQ